MPYLKPSYTRMCLYVRQVFSTTCWQSLLPLPHNSIWSSCCCLFHCWEQALHWPSLFHIQGKGYTCRGSNFFASLVNRGFTFDRNFFPFATDRFFEAKCTRKQRGSQKVVFPVIRIKYLGNIMLAFMALGKNISVEKKKSVIFSLYLLQT